MTELWPFEAQKNSEKNLSGLPPSKEGESPSPSKIGSIGSNSIFFLMKAFPLYNTA